ncbi:MAG: hypothetical protein ACO1N0_14485 [Fluviicola sp.]
MKRLRILTLFALLAAWGIHLYKESIAPPTTVAYKDPIPKEWFQTEGEILTPKKDRRKPDQTFLTYPEWFLVFSPEEQALFFKKNTATDFKYVDHLDQFWDSYEIIKKPVEANYPYNEEYHTMIQIIGRSTDIEYGAKAWYETVIGRLTNPSNLSQEDHFQQRFTDNYAKSLHEVFWYDYNFKHELNLLWTENDLWGPNIIRKMERKYLLTSELAVKKGYGDLIRFGAHSMYGQAPSTTAVVVHKVTPEMKKDPTMEIVEILKDGTGILRVPRYTAFKTAAEKIARQNCSFIEIAGNKSAIMVTIIAPKNTRIYNRKSRTLFTQSISNDPSMKRIALVTPVKNLSEMLRYFEQRGLTVEHIFDY